MDGYSGALGDIGGKGLLVHVGAYTKPLERGLMRAEGRVKTFAHTAGRDVARGAKIMGAALLGAAGYASKMAADYDQAMRNVNSISKLSDASLNQLSGDVLKLAAAVGKSPKELAEGLYDIASSGFQAGKGMTVLEASTKAARAGMSDVRTSARAIVGVLNAYGMSADRAGYVSDVLFKTVEVGVITFEELAQNLGDVTSSAAAMGVSIDQVGGAIAAFTKAGITAPEAVTALNRVIMAFIKPSEAMKKLVKDAGFESGQAMLKHLGLAGAMDKCAAATKGSVSALGDLFPEVRGIKGALVAVSGGGKIFRDSMGQVKDSAGATASAFKEQMKGMVAQYERVKAQLEVAGITVATKIVLPSIKDITGKMGNLMNALISGPGSSNVADVSRWKRATGGKFQALGAAIGKTIASGISGAIGAVGDSAGRTFGGRFVKGFREEIEKDRIASAILYGAIGGKLGSFVGHPVIGTAAGATYGATKAEGASLISELERLFYQAPAYTHAVGPAGPALYMAIQAAGEALGRVNWDEIRRSLGNLGGGAAWVPPAAATPGGRGRATYNLGVSVTGTAQVEGKLHAWAVRLRSRFAKWGRSAIAAYVAGMIAAAPVVNMNTTARSLERGAIIINARTPKWGRQSQINYAVGMIQGRPALMRSWNLSVRALEGGASLLNIRGYKWGQTFINRVAAGMRSRLSAIRAIYGEIAAILREINSLLGPVSGGSYYRGGGGGGKGGRASVERGEREDALAAAGFNSRVTPRAVLSIARFIHGVLGTGYVWGAWDCSAFVSAALAAGWLLSGRETSRSFAGVCDVGRRGPVMVVVKPGHVGMQVMGREFENSGSVHKNDPARRDWTWYGVPIAHDTTPSRGYYVRRGGAVLVDEGEKITRGGGGIHFHGPVTLVVEGAEDAEDLAEGLYEAARDYRLSGGD